MDRNATCAFISKTILFEKHGPGARFNAKSLDFVSQNSFLISRSLKSPLYRRVVRDERWLPKKTERKATVMRIARVRRPAPRKPYAPWTREDGEVHGMASIGYARVSTLDQNPALQQDALKEAGCGKIFIEQMSGAVEDRPALCEALQFASAGDILVVWKLDRLARSMKQLIETVEKLRLRGIGFRSLTEAIDTTTAQGVWCSTCFSALAEFERASFESAPGGLKAARRGADGRQTGQADRGRSRRARTLLANPILPSPTWRTASAYRPRRSIDTCPPRRTANALRK